MIRLRPAIRRRSRRIWNTLSPAVALLLVLFGVVACYRLVGMSRPAAGQTMCASLDVVREMLRSQYGETVQTAGVSATGELVLTFASPAGTWTLVRVPPAEPLVGCPVETGRDFEFKAQLKKGEPS